MKTTFYKVSNVPPNFQYVYVARKEIYFLMESLNLTKSDVITMVLEFNGDALIGGEKNGQSGIYISSKTIRRALVKKLINQPDDFSLESFDKIVEIVKTKIAEASNG
jgi:hypothetical protein